MAADHADRPFEHYSTGLIRFSRWILLIYAVVTIANIGIELYREGWRTFRTGSGAMDMGFNVVIVVLFIRLFRQLGRESALRRTAGP